MVVYVTSRNTCMILRDTIPYFNTPLNRQDSAAVK